MSDGGGRPASSLVAIPPYEFFEARRGRGTPIILIHGLGGSADWWRHNIGPLSDHHLVSAIDLVGFGRNRFFLRRSALPLAFQEIAGLLGRWIASSFDGPVHLAGNSMGGHIAIHLAATRPELVRSLTLVNSTGVPFAVAPGEHIRNLVMPRGFWSFLLVLARDAFRAGPTSVALALLRLLRDDVRPLLRTLLMPVLLLWGNRDPFVPLSYGKQMLASIPHARLDVIEGAGHIPMWEQPEVFNEKLLTFVDDVDRMTASPAAQPRFSWALSGWSDGIAHREAGTRRDAVLIHGLGMSSAYFKPLARALCDRGVDAIAPDLPNFGDSESRPLQSPRDAAALLIAWADRCGIRNAIWIGHSIGCNVVAHVAAMRPDLVRGAPVAIGPLWHRHPMRLLVALMIDALREPLPLFRYVAHAYWRCGIARWLGTFWLAAEDVAAAPPVAVTLVAGARDPLPNRAALRDIALVPGAHACFFRDADATADAVMTF